MTNKTDASTQSYWEGRYQDQLTSWNIGKEHPRLHRLLAAFQNKGSNPDTHPRVLVPGAGHGHCAAFWASRGFQTTTMDFAPSAIEAATSLYGTQTNLNIEAGDVFAPRFGADSFDVVYDRAMLCALPPDKRADYVASMTGLLRSGGVFSFITFTRIEKPEGPPWQISIHELADLLDSHFDLMFAEDYTYEKKQSDQIILGETVSLWRKR